jgi:hypothetical protein
MSSGEDRKTKTKRETKRKRKRIYLLFGIYCSDAYSNVFVKSIVLSSSIVYSPPLHSLCLCHSNMDDRVPVREERGAVKFTSPVAVPLPSPKRLTSLSPSLSSVPSPPSYSSSSSSSFVSIESADIRSPPSDSSTGKVKRRGVNLGKRVNPSEKGVKSDEEFSPPLFSQISPPQPSPLSPSLSPSVSPPSLSFHLHGKSLSPFAAHSLSSDTPNVFPRYHLHRIASNDRSPVVNIDRTPAVRVVTDPPPLTPKSHLSNMSTFFLSLFLFGLLLSPTPASKIF